MTWPSTFVDRLTQGNLSPIWAVEVLPSSVAFTSALIPGGSALTLSTGLTPARYPWLMGGEDAVVFGAHGVQPVEWAAEHGSWGFALAVTGQARETAIRALGRGKIVRLKMGWQGQAWADFVTVQAGRISGMEDRGEGILSFEVWDLVSALTGRFRGDVRAYPQLFSGMAASTTVSGGAYHAGDATLHIASVPSGSRKRTGGTGLVKVTPNGGGGQPFYLTYTGSTSTTLTGVGSTAKFGTTAATAGNGSTVAFVPYLYGPLVEIVAQVLTSTGAGTGGAYDVLPVDWGYALVDREDVDVRDILSIARLLAPASPATDSIEVLVDPLPTDSRAWLEGILSAFGAWLTMRQGLVTMRCAQDIREASRASALVSSVVIPPEQIISAKLALASWANVVHVSAGATSTSGTSALGSPFQSYPAYGAKIYDITPYVWSYQPDYRGNVRDRLRWWAYTLGETLTIEVAGLAGWRLCPGDVIRLTCARIGGMYASTLNGWVDRLALVTNVQPNPARGTVSLRLATLPHDAADLLE